MSKKYWAIVILALLAVIILTIYYVNQPALDLGPIIFRYKAKYPVSSTNEIVNTITNWQEYKDTEWGFSISYPNGYVVSDGQFKKERPYYKVLVDLVPSPDKQYTKNYISLSISVVNDSDRKDSKYYTSMDDYISTSLYNYADFKKTSVAINGQSGYQVDTGKLRYIILQAKDGIIYQLSFPADDANMNVISSTFKFTK